MYADLHLHSRYSDGTMSPAEIALSAKEHGIGIISVTDHNTTAAYPEILSACAQNGVLLIPGVEIDCMYGDLLLHLLAYGFDLQNPPLRVLLDENLFIYEQKSVDMLAAMSRTHPQLSLDEYARFERDPRNGGWKGIDYLRSKGFAADYPECMAYYREIGWRRPLPPLHETCSAIHGAGGLAVLAHPGDRLDNEKSVFSAALETLRREGIDGVECYYPSHTPELTQICLDFCRKNKLLITAGSDCHGDFARFVDNVCYDMGSILMDEKRLNLGGLI